MQEVDRTSNTPSNPFSDQAAIQDERNTIVEATLAIGRNASLTLGTDAVIVLGLSHSVAAQVCLTYLRRGSTR